MQTEEIKKHPIIFFDGVCNLCSNTVQFVIKRDRKGLFRFASLQSAFAQKVMHQFQLDASELNSFLLYKNGKLYTKSTGALLVAKELDGGWSFLAAAMVIPAFIRNGVYALVARNRYRWFGKKEECWLPTPDLKARFIDL